MHIYNIKNGKTPIRKLEEDQKQFKSNLNGITTEANRMFNKQDATVYLTNIKILKDLNILNFRLHIPEAIFKVL